jgi:hypothetical protein
MIEARTARAAAVAVKSGFDYEIKGSLLKIFNQTSGATVLFRSDHIVLEQLSVELADRRHNHGSATLEAVIAIANDAGLRLELIAEPPLHPHQADLSQTDLQAWYRRRKFIDAGDILMSRMPDHGSQRAWISGRRPSAASWALRPNQFFHYARSGFEYSADAGATFYGFALSFLSDWCDLGITAVDQLTQTYHRT